MVDGKVIIFKENLMSVGSTLLELQEIDLTLMRDKEQLQNLPEIAELARRRKLYIKLKGDVTKYFAQCKDVEIDLQELDSREQALHDGIEKARREVDMDDYRQRREDKQPLDMPSAGSTFKRPEGHFAGKLIMDAGLRGHAVGGAQVSEKHCGFIVNADHATAADVDELIRDIQAKVKEQFGVDLQPEVHRVGEFL